MVNEVVGTGDWEETEALGETWRGRNVFSYGRNEGNVESEGISRPQVLNKLLATTERVVQEIDSVEYGLTDMQGKLFIQYNIYHATLPLSPNHKLFIPIVLLCFLEYYANTGGKLFQILIFFNIKLVSISFCSTV
jgi:CobN/Magnesium Chelatase